MSTKHTNLPARILTREHHNMNLPTHIIMCSSPVMNLPAHDNIKHLPDQDQHNKPCKTYHNTPGHCTIIWRSISTARQNGSADRLAVPHHRWAQQLTRLSYFLLSPNDLLYTARHYTSSMILLVLGTVIQFLAFTHSVIKHPEIKIDIHILQITTSQQCIFQV